MITLGAGPLEPRHVVLASVAEARMSEAASELEALEARLREVEDEVEAGEQRVRMAPAPIEIPESAQLTQQLVDDLVSTNRERMREQVSQRYAWAGERLSRAHARAQADVRDALAELTAAMREDDAGRGHQVNDLPLAALMAAMASAGPMAAGPPIVAAVPFIEAEQVVGTSGTVPDDLEPSGPADWVTDSVGQPAPTERSAAPVLGPPGPATKHSGGGLAIEDEAPLAFDGVVDSAVQAIMKALTEPVGATTPVPPVPAALRSFTPAGGRSDASRFDAVAASAPESFRALEPLAPALDGDDAQTRGYEAFWSEKVQSTESRPSGFRPRDVMIAMLVVTVLVLVALAFIG